jgi:hypothetical protein
MLVMLIAFLIAVFSLLCIHIPSIWSTLMAINKPSDHHKLGLVVAYHMFYATPSPSNAYMFSLNIRKPFP